MLSLNRKYLYGCIACALLLCAAQISGSAIAIFACIAAFVVISCIGCIRSFTLPMLMFFLPWSPLLKLDIDSFSFYTVVLVLVCMISVVKNWYRFKRYHITAGILLVLLTLLSKIIDGSTLSMDYICFMMLIVLFPVVCEEKDEAGYDFYGVVVFFSAGIILSALCAQQFASYRNIAKYIDVHSYLTIVRKNGFYGDPNFYTAQITAALGGCLILILKERAKGRMVFLGILTVLLLYCGFLSGSKSFALVSGGILFMWFIELMRIRGRFGFKLAMVLCGLLVTAYILTSSLFADLLRVLITRFTMGKDMYSFTTGRTSLWLSYYEAILEDVKVLLIGKGFTNVKVNARASHNTIIQMIFQFGMIGSAILWGWIVCFFKEWEKDGTRKRGLSIRMLILLFGAFFPWMAIDALFFDEFFLMQWFCLVGIQDCRKEIEQID